MPEQLAAVGAGNAAADAWLSKAFFTDGCHEHVNGGDAEATVTLEKPEHNAPGKTDDELPLFGSCNGDPEHHFIDIRAGDDFEEYASLAGYVSDSSETSYF